MRLRGSSLSGLLSNFTEKWCLGGHGKTRTDVLCWLFSVARKIPFDDPVVLNYVRIAYVGSQLLALAIYYYVSLTVSRVLFLVVSRGRIPDARPLL